MKSVRRPQLSPEEEAFLEAISTSGQFTLARATSAYVGVVRMSDTGTSRSVDERRSAVAETLATAERQSRRALGG